jgi:hypothetical protein
MLTIHIAAATRSSGAVGADDPHVAEAVVA